MNRARIVDRLSIVALLISMSLPGLNADELQLVNGDTVRGHVVALDEKQVRVKSELLGELTIERKNVRSIQLSDEVIRSSLPNTLKGELPSAAPPADGGKKSVSVDDLLKQLQASGGKVDSEDLIKRFEKEGGDGDVVGELKKSQHLLGSPKVQAYVQKQISGLMDGSVKVNDIRNEAIRARDETKKFLKDLPPEAQTALDPYLGILEKFIKETEPPADKKEKK